MVRKAGAEDYPWVDWLEYSGRLVRLHQESDFTCDVERMRDTALTAARKRCIKIKTHIDRTGPFNVLEITILECPDEHRVRALKKNAVPAPEPDSGDVIEQDDEAAERALPGWEEYASGLLERSPYNDEPPEDYFDGPDPE